jgi:hypothetical protein
VPFVLLNKLHLGYQYSLLSVSKFATSFENFLHWEVHFLEMLCLKVVRQKDESVGDIYTSSQHLVLSLMYAPMGNILQAVQQFIQ